LGKKIMPDWIAKIIDSLKLSPRYIAMLAVFCGVVLFTPMEKPSALGVAKLQEDYRAWFGIVFIFCCSVLSIHGFLFLHRRLYQCISIRNLRQRLHHLTQEEKSALSGYILGRTRTQNFDFRSGVVAQLEAEHVIARTSNLVHVIDGCPYSIQPWAWDYLTEHPELLR
jgi:hypothetical protein